MKKGSIHNIEYRLMINGKPTWHALKMIRSLEDNADYFIFGVINIDDEVKRREAEKETARQKEAYNQITAGLAGQYDTLYYINLETNKYVVSSSTDEFKSLNVPATGNDFFAESRRSIRKYVHPEDQDQITKLHFKDTMLENLKHRNSYSVTYRMVINEQVKHVRHN